MNNERMSKNISKTIQKKYRKTRHVVFSCNPSMWETKPGDLPVWCQPGTEKLSKRKEEEKEMRRKGGTEETTTVKSNTEANIHLITKFKKCKLNKISMLFLSTKLPKMVSK